MITWINLYVRNERINPLWWKNFNITKNVLPLKNRSNPIFPFLSFTLVTTSGSDQIIFIPRLKLVWPADIRIKDLQQNNKNIPLLAVLFYCFSFFLVLLIPSCSNLVAITGSSNLRMTNSMKLSSWSSSSIEQMISLYSITICAASFILLPCTLTNSNYSTNKKSKNILSFSILLWYVSFGIFFSFALVD